MTHDSPPIDMLLIEDDPDDVATVRRLAEGSRAPVRLAVAGHGAEALRLLGGASGWRAGRVAPQLILLDVQLPGMDGIGVLQAIKARPQLEQVPTILLTGSDDDEIVRRGQDLGAHSHIVKPITAQSFAWIVTSVQRYLTRIAMLANVTAEEGARPCCSH